MRLNLKQIGEPRDTVVMALNSLRQALLSCWPGLLLLLAACAGPTAVPSASTSGLATGLPGIADLDALRATSTAQEPIDVTLPVEQANTSALEATWPSLRRAGRSLLPSTASCRRSRPWSASPPAGATGCTCGSPDYARAVGQGRPSCPLASRLTRSAPLAIRLPPAVYVYCAVVAPVGVQGQLTSLALNYDGPAHIYYVAPPRMVAATRIPALATNPGHVAAHGGQCRTDTLVIVQPGIYAPFNLISAGAEDAPIIWSASPGATIDAMGGGVGIYWETVSWNIIDGFTVINAAGWGIAGALPPRNRP